MEPGLFYFDDAVVNDGIDPVVFRFTEEGSPMDLTGMDVTMTLRFPKLDIERVLGIGTGVTILNAAGGEVRIEEFALDIVGDWFYDLQITASGGLPRTYVRGKIEILSEITT